MQIIINDMLVHYERAGKGPAVLILPGWADTSANWLAVLKSLSGAYDVIVLDLPGFGGSQPPARAWSLDDYSKFVTDFLSKLGTKELYAVIGHSNGGALAIRALGLSHIKSEKLILVASAGVRAVQQGRKGLLKVVAKTGKTLSAPLPGRVKQKLRARLYSSIGSDMLVAGHMQETFKQIVDDDVQADAAHLRLPTLLIYGDKDTETPLRYGETLQKLIQHSKLSVVPGADHFLHVKNAEKLQDEIVRFLR